jgi:hypothetical protein
MGWVRCVRLLCVMSMAMGVWCLEAVASSVVGERRWDGAATASWLNMIDMVDSRGRGCVWPRLRRLLAGEGK